MKISIITATFNNEKTIIDCLNSVYEQNYTDIEHIIIDGKSTDKTILIIEENKKKITKIISEPDNGIYDALNKGIKQATGDIIGFLHADDIYASKNIIKSVSECFTSKKADSVYGDLKYVSEKDTSKTIRYWKSEPFKKSLIKKGWMPPHPTFFVKKEIYEKYGYFNTNYKIAADYDLILRFLGKHKISTHYIPEVFIKMRVGGASNRSLKNIIQKSKEDYKALKKNNLGGIYTLLMKNFSKITQFIKKGQS